MYSMKKWLYTVSFNIFVPSFIQPLLLVWPDIDKSAVYIDLLYIQGNTAPTKLETQTQDNPK